MLGLGQEVGRDPLRVGRVVGQDDQLRRARQEIDPDLADDIRVTKETIDRHESNLDKIRVGLPVRITVDALPGQEFIGRVNDQAPELSVARMKSPTVWVELGQRPEFTEYTVVLSGTLRVEYDRGVVDVHAGQAIVAEAGEWVRYS